jgi:outer membrane protein insertion porin family
VNATYANYEASLAVKESAGTRITSQVGYAVSYNTLDNVRNPSQGIYAEFKQDVAGAGGDARFVKTTAEGRYFYPIWDDVVGFAKVQGGNVTAYGGTKLRMTDNFNLGPSLVRGFAPGGIGPRDMSSGLDTRTNSLGGTNFVGGSVELQFPFFGVPKDLGLKAALFADAGTLFGYQGNTNFSTLLPGLAPNAPCQASNVAAPWQSNCIKVEDSSKIRSSVGASLLWASPLGPIRFDYAFVLSKANTDVGQAFRFSGGGSF